MRTPVLVLSLLCLAPSLGCGARKEAPPPPAATPPPAAPAPDPALARLSLMERLQRESAARPAGTPRPEDVQAALGSHGITLERWKQVLATPVGARFCMAGETPHGLGVAVCEYGSEAEAARGLGYSRATFDRLIPNRRLSVNRKTLLTLTPATPAVGEEATRVATAFAAL
jgi:hypothetical protein